MNLQLTEIQSQQKQIPTKKDAKFPNLKLKKSRIEGQIASNMRDEVCSLLRKAIYVYNLLRLEELRLGLEGVISKITIVMH